MSRTTSRGTLANRYADNFSNTTGATSVYIDTVSSVTVSTLTRSDITRNPIRTSDGWRNPSAYESTLTAAEPGIVQILLDNPNNNRTFRNLGKAQPSTAAASFQITKSKLEAEFPPLSHVDNAVIKARNNVADRVASFSESLAELSQSVAGLGKLASQIDRFLTAALTKDYKKVADSLGIPRRSRKHRRAVIRYNDLGVPTVSNAFLCWNFGLKPIVNDMVSLAILMGEGKPLRVVGKALFPYRDVQRTHTDRVPVSYTAAHYDVNFKETVKSGTYVRLDYSVSFEMLRNLTSYGLMDAPATLWALAPYSFLVDFVLPVGEVLRSLTATAGLTFKGGSATRFTRIDRVYQHTVRSKDTATLVWKACNVDVGDLSGMHMKRTVFIREPNPVSLWIKDPCGAFETATVFSLLGKKLRLR